MKTRCLKSMLLVTALVGCKNGDSGGGGSSASPTPSPTPITQTPPAGTTGLSPTPFNTNGPLSAGMISSAGGGAFQFSPPVPGTYARSLNFNNCSSKPSCPLTGAAPPTQPVLYVAQGIYTAAQANAEPGVMIGVDNAPTNDNSSWITVVEENMPPTTYCSFEWLNSQKTAQFRFTNFTPGKRYQVRFYYAYNAGSLASGNCQVFASLSFAVQ